MYRAWTRLEPTLQSQTALRAVERSDVDLEHQSSKCALEPPRRAAPFATAESATDKPRMCGHLRGTLYAIVEPPGPLARRCARAVNRGVKSLHASHRKHGCSHLHSHHHSHHYSHHSHLNSHLCSHLCSHLNSHLYSHLNSHLCSRLYSWFTPQFTPQFTPLFTPLS